MPSPTFEFFVFFGVVLALNWLLKRWPFIWRLFLLLASWFFYSVFDFRFLLILIGVSFFYFLSGGAIHKNFLGSRKLILTLSIIVNLSVLGVFKYYDFFRASAEALLGEIGFSAGFPLLAIILPVGLSFYIFRTISYNADIYLKKIEPSKSILDFSIYVSFFPQLLAGPIARAGDFLPQLKDGGAKKIENVYENFTLILLGLFKKVVISSYLVLNIVDDVYAVPGNHSSLVILMAIIAYSLVIYFDFSGYTDMAVGFAGLMGFKSPINFNSPYLALNIKDFWRRWHISLSDWIRDYVYIPLGGNRKGMARKYFNLIIMMVLVGLWHGSANHYIVWGFIHGLGLAASHLYDGGKRLSVKKVPGLLDKAGKFSGKMLFWLLTFGFVSFSWIFFRSENTGSAVKMIEFLFNSNKSLEPVQLSVFYFLLAGFILFLFEKRIISGLVNFQKKVPLFVWPLFVILLMILILKFSSDTVPNFIYFGF